MYYLAACQAGSPLQSRQAAAATPRRPEALQAKNPFLPAGTGAANNSKSSPEKKRGVSTRPLESENLNSALTSSTHFRDLRLRWHTSSYPQTEKNSNAAGASNRGSHKIKGLLSHEENVKETEEQQLRMVADPIEAQQRRLLQCRQGLVREQQCGLCEVPFLRERLVTSVSRHAVVQLRQGWASRGGSSIGGAFLASSAVAPVVVTSPQRPTAMYSSVQLCRFCSQFVNVFLGERFADEPTTESIHVCPAAPGSQSCEGRGHTRARGGDRPIGKGLRKTAHTLSALRKLIGSQRLTPSSSSSSSSSAGSPSGPGPSSGRISKNIPDDKNRSISSSSSASSSSSSSSCSTSSNGSSRTDASLPSGRGEPCGGGAMPKKESRAARLIDETNRKRMPSSPMRPRTATASASLDQQQGETIPSVTASAQPMKTFMYHGNRASQLRQDVLRKRRDWEKKPLLLGEDSLKGTAVSDFFTLGDEEEEDNKEVISFFKKEESSCASTTPWIGGAGGAAAGQSASQGDAAQPTAVKIAAKPSEKVLSELRATSGNAVKCKKKEDNRSRAAASTCSTTPAVILPAPDVPQHFKLSGSLKVLVLCCASYTNFPSLPRAIHSSVQVFMDWCERRLGARDVRCYRDSDVCLNRVAAFAADCRTQGSLGLVVLVGHGLHGYAPLGSHGDMHLVLTTEPQDDDPSKAPPGLVMGIERRSLPRGGRPKSTAAASLIKKSRFSPDVSFGPPASHQMMTLSIDDVLECFAREGVPLPTIAFDGFALTEAQYGGGGAMKDAEEVATHRRPFAGLLLLPAPAEVLPSPHGQLLHHMIESTEYQLVELRQAACLRKGKNRHFLSSPLREDKEEERESVTVVDVFDMWRERGASMDHALQALLAKDMAEDRPMQFIVKIVGVPGTSLVTQPPKNIGAIASEMVAILRADAERFDPNVGSSLAVTTTASDDGPQQNQGRILSGERVMLAVQETSSSVSSSSSSFGLMLAPSHVPLSVPATEWLSVADDIRASLADGDPAGCDPLLRDLHISFSVSLSGCVVVFVSSVGLTHRHGAVLRRLRLLGRLRYRVARCGFVTSSPTAACDATGELGEELPLEMMFRMATDLSSGRVLLDVI
jgi:hypothetical protein